MGSDAPCPSRDVFAFATTDKLGCSVPQKCLAGCTEVTSQYLIIFCLFVYFSCCYYKTSDKGREMLNGQEHFLLLQRTRVRIPAPTGVRGACAHRFRCSER